MKTKFQLLDSDYILLDNEPVVRLFGRTESGKTICVFYENYKPYFYAIPKNRSEVTEFLNREFKHLILDISEVERFLPIGYQETKSKLLKITIKDPSQVPAVREKLLARGLVAGVYEADILFKYRFMADYGLNGMGWYEVNGDPISTTTVKTDITIRAKELQKETGKEDANIKFLSIDIEIGESRGDLPNAEKDPISMISLAFSPNHQEHKTLVLVSKPVNYGETVISYKDEKAMLEAFLKIIDSFDPDVITGYNTNGFDMPYIFTRLDKNKLPRNLGRDTVKQSFAKKFGMRTKVSILGRVTADVYELVKESVGKGILRLKRYGLGDVSRELLGLDKVDVAHGEIPKYWKGTKEQLEKLIDYARVDAILALTLLMEKKMLDKFIELAKVSGLLLQDVLDSGEATRVENVLLREFNREGFVLPMKPTDKEVLNRKLQRETEGLKGALVLEPTVGLQTNCVVYLDFKSMYPSIFMSYNICPTTLCSGNNTNLETTDLPDKSKKFVSPKVRTGIIPKIVQNLIRERDVVKKLMKTEASDAVRRILNAKQLALKYVTNSFYGYTGYVLGRVYSMDIASAITSCGRYLIQTTRDTVEEDKKYTVIYGDTDSIMVDTKTTELTKAIEIGKEIEAKINEKLAGIVQMKTESVFKTLLVLAKKRYAGLVFEQSNGELKERIEMKGIETVRRDWCDLTSETLFNVLGIILKEQSPKKAVEYVKEILKKLESNEIPVEKLVVTKSISKSLKEYKGVQPHIEVAKKIRKRSPSEAPSVGDRVGFVIIHGSQMMSERAEDPEYAKLHKLRIDSKYYIESQILPPLERVFDAIGVTKGELVGIGRQMGLFEAIKNGNKQNEQKVLQEVDGFVCKDCNQDYRRIPLIGKCDNCNGEILFSHGTMKSRHFSPR